MSRITPIKAGNSNHNRNWKLNTWVPIIIGLIIGLMTFLFFIIFYFEIPFLILFMFVTILLFCGFPISFIIFIIVRNTENKPRGFTNSLRNEMLGELKHLKKNSSLIQFQKSLYNNQNPLVESPEQLNSHEEYEHNKNIIKPKFYCKYCGNNLAPGATFCQECGIRIV